MCFRILTMIVLVAGAHIVSGLSGWSRTKGAYRDLRTMGASQGYQCGCS